MRRIARQMETARAICIGNAFGRIVFLTLHVNAWSNQKFPCFLAWATTHFPYAFGHISHIRRFLDCLLPSGVQATHTRLASTLHACVPALGMPSFFLASSTWSASTAEACFQPSMFFFTDSQGHLSWALLGCPCLAYTDK